jgi:hypothetical protein
MVEVLVVGTLRPRSRTNVPIEGGWLKLLDCQLNATVATALRRLSAALLFACAAGRWVRRSLLLLMVGLFWHAVTDTDLETFGVTYALLVLAWLAGARLRSGDGRGDDGRHRMASLDRRSRHARRQNEELRKSSR